MKVKFWAINWTIKRQHTNSNRPFREHSQRSNVTFENDEDLTKQKTMKTSPRETDKQSEPNQNGFLESSMIMLMMLQCDGINMKRDPPLHCHQT